MTDDESRVGRLVTRRSELREEIRSRLGLPEWSNLRGDDVIMLVEGLDEASRIRLNDLFVELREIEDERTMDPPTIA
jgi:hypothetical protein